MCGMLLYHETPWAISQRIWKDHDVTPYGVLTNVWMLFLTEMFSRMLEWELDVLQRVRCLAHSNYFMSTADRIRSLMIIVVTCWGQSGIYGIYEKWNNKVVETIRKRVSLEISFGYFHNPKPGNKAFLSAICLYFQGHDFLFLQKRYPSIAMKDLTLRCFMILRIALISVTKVTGIFGC